MPCSKAETPAFWLEAMSKEAMPSGNDSAVLTMPAFCRSAKGALVLAK